MFKPILFVIILCQSVSDTRKLSVGIILLRDEEEIKIAFLSAINHVNADERNFELEPIVRYAKSTDSFQTEKIACELLEKNVVGIFGPTYESGVGVVSSICDAFNIPHILFHWRSEETLDEKRARLMTVNVFPDARKLSEGFRDIVATCNWNRFMLLYDTDEALIQAQHVLHVLRPNKGNNANTAIRLADSREDYNLQLKRIKGLGENFFVLALATEKILPFFNETVKYNLTSEYQNFFITNVDAHTLNFDELHNFQKPNITALRLIDPSSVYLNNTVNDWNSKHLMIDAQRAKTAMVLIHDAVKLFATALKSAAVSHDFEPPNCNCDERSDGRSWPFSFGRFIVEGMTPNNVTHEEGLLSGKMSYDEYGQRIFYSADIVELKLNSFHKLAGYEPGKGVIWTQSVKEKELSDREEWESKIFKIVCRIENPFFMKKEPRADGTPYEGNDRYKGFVVDLFKLISAQLNNFKYELEIVPDNQHGKLDPKTKEWNGIIRHVMDNKADFGIGDITITAERRLVTDFTAPFMSLGISILYVTPEPAATELFSFLSPFSTDVWIYMQLAYLLLAFLIYFVSRFASDDWENPHPCNSNPAEVENIWHLRNTTWLAMGSIMGQGCDILPKAKSTRLITGMWWFFALMMLNSYTANLAAFLTAIRMEEPIRNAEDLAKQTKIKYGLMAGGSTENFFKSSNESVYQKMWAAMEDSPSVFTKSNVEGKDRVIKGKRSYAFLMESTLISYETERNCQLEQIGSPLDVKYYGIVVPLNSRYRSGLNEAILKLSESSRLKELREIWWVNKENPCKKEVEKDENQQDLEMENVGGVFLVLGCGIFVALLIGVGEFLWNVQKVAVDDKLSWWEAFKGEATFAAKFWIRRKPIHTSEYLTRSRRSSRSNVVQLSVLSFNLET